jgi:hypothetical protein
LTSSKSIGQHVLIDTHTTREPDSKRESGVHIVMDAGFALVVFVLAVATAAAVFQVYKTQEEEEEERNAAGGREREKEPEPQEGDLARSIAERTLRRPIASTTVSADLPRLARKTVLWVKEIHEEERERDEEEALCAADAAAAAALFDANVSVFLGRADRAAAGAPAGRVGADDGLVWRMLSREDSGGAGTVVEGRRPVYAAIHREHGECASFLHALLDLWDETSDPAREEGSLDPTIPIAAVDAHFAAAAGLGQAPDRAVHEFLIQHCSTLSGEDRSQLGAAALLKFCSNQAVLAAAVFRLKDLFRSRGFEFKDVRGTWRVGVVVETDAQGSRTGVRVTHRKWEQDRRPFTAPSVSTGGEFRDVPRFAFRWCLEVCLDETATTVRSARIDISDVIHDPGVDAATLQQLQETLRLLEDFEW